jgi:hypothetical protein
MQTTIVHVQSSHARALGPGPCVTRASDGRQHVHLKIVAGGLAHMIENLPRAAAFVVRDRAGAPVAMDGPFAETKELGLITGA